MEAATNAWHSMSYLEGFFFTIWLVGLYWGKKRIDLHFDRKMHKRKAIASSSPPPSKPKTTKWFNN